MEHEVVVYSDGSTDGTAEFVSTRPDLVSAHSDVNQGVCTALNRCVAMTTGDYVFLLNSDHVLCPAWDANLVRWLKPNRVVSAMCVEPGRVPVASFFAACNCGHMAQEFHWGRFEAAVQRISRPHAAPGVNHPFVLHRALWDRVGGMDERFNPGPASDPDLFYRLHFEGAEMVRGHNAVLYHFSGKSSRMANESLSEHSSWRQHTERCNRLFVDKWGEYYNHPFGGVPSPGPVAQARHKQMLAERENGRQ